MKENSDNHDMLIYCGATNVEDEDSSEDVRQIDYITRMLNFEYGMRVVQFTSHENEAERQNRIADFKNREVQALVAIKCLDEGVNIPSIRTAFILASTTNPKEYVQRRGRVLRRYPGKEYADIYDFVTLPRPLDVVVNSDYELAKHELALVKNEITRMGEFRDLSMNFYKADRMIAEIREAYHLYDDIEFVDEETEWEDNNG
jgi:superfamily II DNA or RNA helicase